MQVSNYLSKSNNVPFQKRLVAKCAIKNANGSEKCNIYLLNRDKDSHYYDKYYYHSNSPDNEWQSAEYIGAMPFKLNDYISGYENTSFYVMEDSNDELVGYCVVDDSHDDSVRLFNIETKPTLAHKNKTRGIKYIGETLITFLTELAKKQDKKWLYVPSVDEAANDFYFKNCKFDQWRGGDSSARMNNEDFQKIIVQNERHTGSKITLVV